jgi:nucleotide-binding universal stress UspA family protein
MRRLPTAFRGARGHDELFARLEGVMFTKVLVPLDRSPLARQAIDDAVAIARASGAALDLLLVHQVLAEDPYGFAVESPAERLEAERAYLAEIANTLAATSSSPVTCAVESGETVATICRRATAVGADLIAMTSHGRTGLSRLWLGSVADGVIRNAAIPVLMLRPAAPTAVSATPGTYQRILVPLDGTEESLEILPAAAALAKAQRKQLSLLRVIAPVLSILPGGDSRFDYVPPIVDGPESQKRRLDAEVWLREIADDLREVHDVEADCHVVVDNRVAAAIIDFAHAGPIGLIAMTTHRGALSRTLLGSVADKVLRGAHMPMLLYRPTAELTGGGMTMTIAEAQVTTFEGYATQS